MTLIDRFFRGRGSAAEERTTGLERETQDTLLEMASVVHFALEVRNSKLRFAEHCTRVTRLVDRLATEAALDADDFVALRFAAQLHEVGMMAVPVELVEKMGPLTDEELQRVRAQAWIGAAMVRATHDGLTARLVAEQYTDFAELRRRYPERNREILLAGILRVADVFDAMTHPRPYQRNLPEGRHVEVLLEGVGTKFHPDAVDTLFQVRGHLA